MHRDGHVLVPLSCLTLLALFGVALAQPDAARPPFAFRDVAQNVGLFPHVANIRGHGAGWGDVDGDGRIDLFVHTFHYEDSKPALLLLNRKGKFEPAAQPALRVSARGTGVVFADLDNDGDLDLYLGNMPSVGTPLAKKNGHDFVPCALFRNEGGAKFTNVSADSGACPPDFGGRSVCVLDIDGDGLLDLLVGEDPLPRYNGSPTKSSRLFKNKGGLKFEDVSRAAGLPADVPGLGVAAADVNNDGWPDFFLASNRGGNRLFLNNKDGTFREAPGTQAVFAWPDAVGDDMVCGACFGDVNRDGLLDLVLGQHYQRPWVKPVANRLYLNRGVKDGNPVFEDVTAKVGLTPLPMKAPHVEIQDFDNDGWPDVYGSLVRFKDGVAHPLVFRNLGVKDGLPRFRDDGVGLNDFPTPADLAVKKTGDFFDKMVKDRKVIYMAPGPSGDFDNDGKLDLFLPNWWSESPSLLLRNETAGGRWLQVKVEGSGVVNRMGVGARVRLYRAGQLGDAKALLGCQDVSAGFGYASGQAAIAHFGLGGEERVDVEVTLPHGKGVVRRSGVTGNQRIVVRGGE